MKYIIVLFFAASMFAQQKKITIEVISSNVPDTSSVFITGGHPSLGEWNPSLMMLNKGKDKWSITLPFSYNSVIEFKFTLGSWNNEALNEDGTIPENNIHNVNNDTTLTFKVNRWGGQKKAPFIGQITGSVKYHRNMAPEKNKIIKPRDVIVWLPPSYDKEKDKRYPVLYAHDGQNMFDPSTSAFGIDWQADETADSLIRKGELQEIIIVGIYNTPQRSKEYMSTDTGYAYMSFIVDELKPFIDKIYRTMPDRENTATMGSSAGGTVSFMLHWEHNDVFGKAACLSPAFKIFHYDFITPFVNDKASKKELDLYIDDGGVGLDSMLLPGVEAMIKELKDKGYKENSDFRFYFYKDAEHNEPAWAERLWNPLLYLFRK